MKDGKLFLDKQREDTDQYKYSIILKYRIKYSNLFFFYLHFWPHLSQNMIDIKSFYLLLNAKKAKEACSS